jgi:DNA repair protein RadA/Sms
VDVIVAFEGDRNSGRRVLAAGKNRFGRDGEIAWFEMESGGLRHVEGAGEPAVGHGETGAAIALPRAGGRSLAVEVQALVVPSDHGRRRQVTGLDPRRFQLLAAVTERCTGLPLSRADLFGAVAGGVPLTDPACDLAVVAALVSAATSVPPPPATAFVGEVSLTGRIRGVADAEARERAALHSGVRTIVGPRGSGCAVAGVADVRSACAWAFSSPSARTAAASAEYGV